MSKENFICIIPARGGSKGIPGKNIMDFCGKPLIAWSIEQAQASRYIKRVFITSDSKTILSIAASRGAEIIERPKELSTDTASAEDALMHAVDYIQETKKEKIDAVIFLQATSPVRTSSDIDKAVRFFISRKADSLFSGAILEDFCIWKSDRRKLKSISFDYTHRGRRQDRQPYYLENGSIYIFKTQVLKNFKNRLGGKIVFFPMPLWKSYEIDKLEDVDMCKYFMNQMLTNEAGREP